MAPRLGPDATEAHARLFLEAEGFRDIVFEPRRNETPDFLVDGRIAVEVRRLGKTVSTSRGHESLEQAMVPLLRRIEKHLEGFRSDPDGRSWFLGLGVRRPIARWSDVENGLNQLLSEWHEPGRAVQLPREIATGVTVSHLIPSSPAAQMFRVGMVSDVDGTGYVVESMLEAVTAAIVEKDRKIAAVVDDYAEWWLILVNQLSYSMDSLSLSQFMKDFSQTSRFKRIILLNRLDHTAAITLVPAPS